MMQAEQGIPVATRAGQPDAFLVAVPASARDKRLALVAVMLSTAMFALALPFAQTQLAAMPAFIAGYQSALILCDLITAVLLFAQFNLLGMQALLPLAAGYLFTAAMALVHMLTFPGLFAPAGLLGAGPQSTAWLYMLWHAGFPLMVLAYAGLKDGAVPRVPDAPEGGRWRDVAVAVAGVAIAVTLSALLATAGSALLPPIMAGHQYTPVMRTVVGSVWGLSALSVLVLWRSRPHTLLDLWLMVVGCAWVFDIGLAAVFNQGRYDLGFYAGRIYGLLAACFVLVALLVENTDLYARLIAARERDRQAAQELQRLYEKTRELDELKTRFFANMSHEIRTPMNAIVGLTNLLRREHPTPQQSDRLDKIGTATRHLLSIINDILDYSRIDAHQLRLESLDFPLATTLDHVRSMMAEAARAKGLTIEIEHDRAPAWVRGDPTRIRQGLLNYLGNAVKFSERGRIVMRVEQVDARDGEVLLRFEVQDEGIGVPPEGLARLFEPFVQADASTTRRFGGTGLGLAITQRLARLMGGDAGARSEVGQGSTFWFTAWLARGQPVMPTGGIDPLTQLRRRHAGVQVLLAEDEPTNREVALALLRDAGLSVDTAADGAQAVAMAQRQAYALVLLDIQMPVMDGIAAADRIRRMPGYEHVPLLAFSANVQEEDRRRCEAVGMREFIPKPVDPDVLYNTLLRSLAPAAGPGGDAAGAGAEAAAGAAAGDAASGRAQRDRLRAHFAALPGVDVDAGLHHLHGNVERYVPLLMDFAGRHRDDMAQVARAVEAGRFNEAMLAAHSLKGAAGTLGLVRLQGMAGRLEEAMRAGTPASSLMHQVEGEQMRIAEAVAGLASEQRLAQPSDPVRAQAALQEIEGLLASGEFAAAQVFSGHEALLAASLPSALMTELRRRIGDYDFTAALGTVRMALARMMAEQEGRPR